MSSTSAAVPRLAPLIAGRYQIERLLGEGGVGAVYAVRDVASSQRLALKRLSANASPKLLSLFEREYHTLAGLRHPCIVEVYEYGADEAGPFYTMELVEGADLTQLAPMPWREVCVCLRDIASSLGLLHARGLLHRDLSPRNLLRQPNGRLKLIDFGALTSFGLSQEVAGTPPYMPPESMGSGELDPRSDLFALGAIGYWLLTGVHAYPARHLSELEQLWERPLRPPSSLVRDLPTELDGLIVALLSLEPGDRPRSTAALIESLNGIADLTTETDETATRGYLDSKVLVGRERERERVRTLLARAKDNKGGALLVEGEPGSGRTRMLEEFAVLSRLAGALTLTVSANGHGGKRYEVARELVRLLLAALPQAGTLVDDSSGSVMLTQWIELATGAPQVHDRPSSSHAPHEEHVRLQHGLHALFLKVSACQPLTLLIDDLHEADADSQALLTALATSAGDSRLVIVASFGNTSGREHAVALTTFRNVAARMQLLPLSESDTLALLRSVFGDAHYLERLAGRLHRITAGNPAHCLELAEYLVRSGAASYRDGMWMLSAELDPKTLPKTREEAHRDRLVVLSAEARALARVLSVVDHGVLEPAHCLALAEVDSTHVPPLLEELVREGVLRTVRDGYEFEHDDVKRGLHEELDETQRRRANTNMLTALLQSEPDEPHTQLRASLHALRAGELSRAHALLKRFGAHFATADIEGVANLAPMLEEVDGLLASLDQDPCVRAVPLALLACAGYFVDRRLGARHGERALQLLEQLLRLRLARRLRWLLGRKLAIKVALALAVVGLSKQKERAPSLPVLMRLLFACSTALAGVASVCTDPAGALRCAKLIEPFTVFGADTGGAILHRYIVAIASGVSDRPAQSAALIKSLIERLESERPISNLSKSARTICLGGCYTTLGTIESRRDQSSALALADRIENFGPLLAMSADAVRWRYHAAQGDLDRAEHFRRQVELHAIQLGTAWQVETWSPADASKTASRTHDPLLMKRAARDLSRLAAEIPAFEQAYRRSQAGYLIMRRKFEEALPLLDDHGEPCVQIGWSANRFLRARALRGLGRYQEAREVCRETLAHLTPGDLAYTDLHLIGPIELALAEANLGAFETANAELDRMIAQHAPQQGRLTMGALHDTRAEVCLLAGDFEGCRHHTAELERWVRPTGIPSLLERAARLRRLLRKAEHPEELEPIAERSRFDPDSAMLSRVDQLLTDSTERGAERADRALQVSVELAGARAGFLLLRGDEQGERSLAQLGCEPSPELLAWASNNLVSELDEPDTALVEQADVVTLQSERYRAEGALTFCAAPLRYIRRHDEVSVGVIALGFVDGAPRMISPNVLGVLAKHLARTDG
jgi:tetratricopeptide (TPR) repeat protein